MSEPRLSSLYVCYLSLEDPLVETQVVAYLAGLTEAGHRVHLLTFEPAGMSEADRGAAEKRLADRGITWHRARYHKRFSLPATIFDTLVGMVVARRLVRRHALDLVHARSHVPAAMALGVRRLAGVPFIFDIRGLMAEEYVDAGRWKQGGVPFRLTKAVERRAIERASGAVVLTEGARELLFPDGGPLPVEVIPCCVDLGGFSPERRAALSVDAPVVAYVGKFGGWYMAEGMAELFARVLRRWPGSRFAIFTQGDQDEIRSELTAAGVPSKAFTIASAPPERIGAELERADVGLSLIRPVPSKIASSPTKNAEYLAAGLPLIATAGVGGTDELLASRPGVAVAIGEFDEAGYERALDELEVLLGDPETPVRCRTAAEELSLRGRGIPAYLHLYQQVAERLKGSA